MWSLTQIAVSRVKGLLSALHSSQRSNERPLFTPGRDPASLSIEWDVLEVAEQEYWAAIRSLYAAFVEYDHACASFNANHEAVTSWLQECRNMFDNSVIGDSVSQVENQLVQFSRVRFSFIQRVVSILSAQVNVGNVRTMLGMS